MKKPHDSTLSPLQLKLNSVIFGYDSRAGKLFDVCLILLISLSVLVVVLDSIPNVSANYHQTLLIFEYGFTLFFTIEYLARLYCSKSTRKYALSFFGIIDILAIIPSYIAFFVSGAQVMLIFRVIRILRIIRILKLVRYIREANVLMRSIILARRKILLFMFSVFSLTIVFGALMYVIEGPEHGFSSIPRSIYWAIVTITTVGYGDISPATPLGQALAALLMITGFSIISVPTGIIGAELFQQIKQDRLDYSCDNCHRKGHEADAKYCKYCAHPIDSKPNKKQ